MFHTKFLEEIKHVFYAQQLFFFRKSCRLWDVRKFNTAREGTNDNIIRRMRSSCWITKATHTHSKYVILIAFPPQECHPQTRLIVTEYTYIYISCLIIVYYILAITVRAYWSTRSHWILRCSITDYGASSIKCAVSILVYTGLSPL